jgi:hypothetical protein
MVPTDPLKMIAFFEQCQATEKVAGVLKKRTSSQRKGKRLNFLLHVAVNQATVNIAVVNIATTTKATDATAMINNPTNVIKMINATIALDAMTRT